MDQSSNLFYIIFDSKRTGLQHIGKKICSYLDYHTLISFKRTCKLAYSFLFYCTSEHQIFTKKLFEDWRSGEASEINIPLDFPPTASVTNVKVINDGNDILVSIDKSVFLYNLYQNNQTSSIISNIMYDKINELTSLTGLDSRVPAKVFSDKNENREKSKITQFDILKDCLVAGNHNGGLSIWDMESTILLNSEQVAGVITVLRCLEQESILAISHIGKDFGLYGCITLYRMNSSTELEVLWFMDQDVMPIFDLDISCKYLVSLEWLRTSEDIRMGSAKVYYRVEEYCSENLGMRSHHESGISYENLFPHFGSYRNTRYTTLKIFR